MSLEGSRSRKPLGGAFPPYGGRNWLCWGAFWYKKIFLFDKYIETVLESNLRGFFRKIFVENFFCLLRIFSAFLLSNLTLSSLQSIYFLSFLLVYY